MMWVNRTGHDVSGSLNFLFYDVLDYLKSLNKHSNILLMYFPLRLGKIWLFKKDNFAFRRPIHRRRYLHFKTGYSRL